MTTFVLLHGGAAGAWIWKFLDKELRARGHEVLAVTFTGFAERRHLCGTHTNVETHVADVVNALGYHEVEDCVLVAHSYAGAVAPGVVAAASARIRKLVCLDSIVVRSGETIVEAMGYMPRGQALALLAGVRNGSVPIYSPVAEQQRAEAAVKPFRMSAERQAWVLRNLSSMPMVAGLAPVEVGAESVSCPVTYVAASDSLMKPVMQPRARAMPWTVHDFDGDHLFPVGEPELTAALLERFST